MQISLLATPAPVPAVEANPLAVQRALFSVPGIVNVCHGLWNDTSRVVSFNREHLHLDAAEASIDITRGTDAWTFGAADVTSAPIVSGRFAAPGRPAGALGRSLVTLLGPKAMVRILSSRTAKAKVANTTRPGVQGGRLAQTYTQGARQGLRPADTADQVVLLHPRYADLSFSLGSVQVIDGLRFVYERPGAPIVTA